jgi:hypothetical protein
LKRYIRSRARIDRLIRSKKGKLYSLSRFRLDMDAETADLYIPFYIFRYGGNKFGFYPLVEASSSKGLVSRFKRLFTENLQSKMTIFLKPRAEFVEKYLAKAVRALSRNTGLAAALRQVDDEANLLRRREAIDKTMMGFVKMRREGWISNSEYIGLQEEHIEKCIIN